MNCKNCFSLVMFVMLAGRAACFDWVCSEHFWGVIIMITERDRICFYIATILETAYRSEC